MKYIIGNWKSNKTQGEVEDWFKDLNNLLARSGAVEFKNLEIVICPPLIYLPYVRELINKYKLPLKTGAQNLSQFDQGAYTGEVTGSMIAQYAKYVLIGHSERRKYFQEMDAVLFEKAKLAKAVGLIPVYCVPDDKTNIPNEITIVAYEPVWAIGTGQADTPRNAGKVMGKIKKAHSQIANLIYGGSVTPQNVKSFMDVEMIDGVLPGKASLDARLFWQIITNASD